MNPTTAPLAQQHIEDLQRAAGRARLARASRVARTRRQRELWILQTRRRQACTT